MERIFTKINYFFFSYFFTLFSLLFFIIIIPIIVHVLGGSGSGLDDAYHRKGY